MCGTFRPINILKLPIYVQQVLINVIYVVKVLINVFEISRE